MPNRTPFSEQDLRAAVARAVCWIDVMRYLGYANKGANIKTIRRWAAEWEVSTAHFDPHAGRRRASAAREVPLEEAMVENSTYSRGKLKRRLLAAGIKHPVCEICGQGEIWNGSPMSLVLDHVNGNATDHRLQNLRMLCPNCNATLPTHCGRNVPRRRICVTCGESFAPATLQTRYCSLACWGKVHGQELSGISHAETRKVERPPYEQLQAELAATNYSAVGRKYGVSDNAVRKWVRFYEREQRRLQGRDAA